MWIAVFSHYVSNHGAIVAVWWGVNALLVVNKAALSRG